ncbi:MAG: dTMP kinase [Acidiferrobacterales bacterium]
MTSKKNTGFFITLEGGEGAGKSTNLEYIQNKFIDAGFQVLITREPGGTKVGENIRELLLHARGQSISGDTELILMFAARMQHLHEIIEPALLQGKIVICDRFTDATFAYQGGGRGIPDERINTLKQWVQQGREPDLTLLFDLPIEQGLERANNRSSPDRFEKESLVFFKRVREKYLDIAEREPNRVKVIDSDKTSDVVHKQLDVILDKVLDRL